MSKMGRGVVASPRVPLRMAKWPLPTRIKVQFNGAIYHKLKKRICVHVYTTVNIRGAPKGMARGPDPPLGTQKAPDFQDFFR